MAETAEGRAAWFDLLDLATDTLGFVRPAPAPGDGHVAWYSETVMLDSARIICAGAHLGRRDGDAFAHIHGVWAGRVGERHAGHLLAEDTMLARDTEVDALVIEGALLESVDDPETRFRLFRPVSTGSVDRPNAVLATVRPHEVLDDTIAKIAYEAGLEKARIRGLGSLVGTQFDDHAGPDSYATEVLLTTGHLAEDRATLKAVSVGFEGPPIAGVLRQSRNTICVTFELLLVAE